MLYFDCMLELIMGISDYLQQLRYFRNRSVSSDYCLVLCYIYICIYLHCHTDIYTTLYKHCVQF